MLTTGENEELFFEIELIAASRETALGVDPRLLLPVCRVITFTQQRSRGSF